MSLYHRRAKELQELGFTYDRQVSGFRCGSMVLPTLRVILMAVDATSWDDYIERITTKMEEESS